MLCHMAESGLCDDGSQRSTTNITYVIHAPNVERSRTHTVREDRGRNKQPLLPHTPFSLTHTPEESQTVWRTRLQGHDELREGRRWMGGSLFIRAPLTSSPALPARPATTICAVAAAAARFG